MGYGTTKNSIMFGRMKCSFDSGMVILYIILPQNSTAAFLPRIFNLEGVGGAQPVSRDSQPVWGENPFAKFLISTKSTEILYPPLVKFSEKSGLSILRYNSNILIL